MKFEITEEFTQEIVLVMSENITFNWQFAQD